MSDAAPPGPAADEEESAAPPQDGGPADGGRRTRRARPWPSVLAVVWLVGAGVALLLPAFLRGQYLGPYDLLRFFGLTSANNPAAHNVVDADQIQQMIPWTQLAWTQVHQGHLPLWNPYGGTGLPLAFNFQSATFSLPVALSYLVPLRFAWSLTLVVKLALAGTGTFVCCRTLGCGVFGATFAGTVFELSGAFSGWLGWPHTGVMCFLGWVLAAVVLVLRHRRVRDVALLSVTGALAVLGGHPESTLLVAGVSVVFPASVAVAALLRRRRRGPRIGRRQVLVSSAALAAGGLGALGLSAPLWLPAMQLVGGSARSLQPTSAGLSPVRLVTVVLQGFYGLPTRDGHAFGSLIYYTNAAYVGVPALVLAVVALVRLRRRPLVTGLAAAGVLCGLLVYCHPFIALVDHLPDLHTVEWYYALMPLDFVLAALAGLGLDHVGRHTSDLGAVRVLGRTWFGAAVVVAAIALGAVLTDHDLTRAQAQARLASFGWPVVYFVVGLLSTLWFRWRVTDAGGGESRPLPFGRAGPAFGLLLVTETAFLLAAGAPLWSSSATGLPTNRAVTALTRQVGPSRVAFADCPSIAGYAQLGLLPDTNDDYGLAELSLYDPIIPLAEFRAWAQISGHPSPGDSQGVFCPSVHTAAQARAMGAAYLLAPSGSRAPYGTLLVGTPDGEDLYWVPGASVAVERSTHRSAGASTATATGSGTLLPTVDGWTPLEVHQHDAADWTVALDAPGGHPATVHLAITDEPGWTASIDGHGVALHGYDRALMAATVPGGRHTLTLLYAPPAFTDGLALALASALALALAGLASIVLARWRR